MLYSNKYTHCLNLDVIGNSMTTVLTSSGQTLNKHFNTNANAQNTLSFLPNAQTPPTKNERVFLQALYKINRVELYL